MGEFDGSAYWRMLEEIRRAEQQQRQIDEATRYARVVDDSVRRAIEERRKFDDDLRHVRQIDDSFRRDLERQRQIDAAAKYWRLYDELGIARRQADLMALPLVSSVLDTYLERQRKMSAVEQMAFGQLRQAELDWLLRTSISPYPNIAALNRATASGAREALYGRLNIGLSRAGLLAEVELDDESDDGKGDQSSVESQLIEVIPAEALDALRRVEFVPFSLLSAAVRDPKMLLGVTPRTFEQFVAELISRLGITDVILTPERADGGRDVLGTVKAAGISLIVAFECKRYALCETLSRPRVLEI